MPEMPLPATPRQTGLLQLEKLGGADLTSGPLDTSVRRSPDAPNMMPGPGNHPVRRPGWAVEAHYGERINGVHFYRQGDTEQRLVHTGTALYKGSTVLYTDMKDDYSQSVQMGRYLWLADGKTYLRYDSVSQSVRTAASLADENPPIISLGRSPGGVTGGTTYMPVNMLTGWRTDSFRGTADDTVYWLSSNNLSGAAVKIEILTASGAWYANPIPVTVDRALGRVTFNTAPGTSAIVGQDNILITYEKAGSNAEVINKSRVCTLYGVGGNLDRVFLGGNPDARGTDYFSEWNDGGFFSDISYSQLGRQGNPIVGYTMAGGQLVAHKNGEDKDRNAYVRTSEMDAEGNVNFPLVNVLQCRGAVSRQGLASFGEEPVYLSRGGVYALTTQDVTGERYAQNRSHFLDGTLGKEADIEACCTAVWGRYYVLAVNGRAYLLDSEQKCYDAGTPHSAFQYEGYHFEHFPARVLFCQGEDLWFGTEGGTLCRLRGPEEGVYTDGEAGEDASAHWTTPFLPLGPYGRRSTVTRAWAVGPAGQESRLFALTDREAEPGTDLRAAAFAPWQEATVVRPGIAPARGLARRAALCALRVAALPGKPLGLQALEVEYVAKGRVKR